MAKKDTFDKMYEVYNAILDIDKIINNPDPFNKNGECKLEQVLFAVRDISKADYLETDANAMISCVRNSIHAMYQNLLAELDADITGVPAQVTHHGYVIDGNALNYPERGTVYAAATRETN